MYEIRCGPKVFALFVFGGALAGLLFDLFKILRKSSKNSEKLTKLCDALFFLTFTIFFLWWIFIINDGEIRWYLFFGLGIGLFIYFLTLSRVIVFAGVFALKLIKKTLLVSAKIILYPFLFLFKKISKVFLIVISPLKRLRSKFKALKTLGETKLRILKFTRKKI